MNIKQILKFRTGVKYKLFKAENEKKMKINMFFQRRKTLAGYKLFYKPMGEN